jgi:putative membrane protein
MSDTPTGTKIGGLVVAAFALFTLVVLVGPTTGMRGFGHMGSGTWGTGGMSGPFMLVGFAMQLLFVVALVGGAVFVYRTVTSDTGDENTALEELRVAYARGDLTDEEFEQRRERLQRDS